MWTQQTALADNQNNGMPQATPHSRITGSHNTDLWGEDLRGGDLQGEDRQREDLQGEDLERRGSRKERISKREDLRR